VYTSIGLVGDLRGKARDAAIQKYAGMRRVIVVGATPWQVTKLGNKPSGSKKQCPMDVFRIVVLDEGE
jgi:hypothetical protein